MIKFERTKVVGWEAAIRGMRNPLESWEKSDSIYLRTDFCDEEEDFRLARMCSGFAPIIKKNDHDLMMRLRNAGTDHRKFMRMIVCYVDITAPLYWWKEFDTYRNGVEKNSCSTMHCIQKKEITLDDFSLEHVKLCDAGKTYFEELEMLRAKYVDKKDKKYWYALIQLLPSSYNQKRTCMISYEALANMYHARKEHKLDEWREGFCGWVKSLPYAELITGEE